MGLALALVTFVGAVRGMTLTESARNSELSTLGEHAAHVARGFERRYAEGLRVSEADLADVTNADMRLTVSRPGEPALTSWGDRFRPEALGDPLKVTRVSGDTTVTAVRSDRQVRAIAWGRGREAILILLASVVLAALLAWVMARWLSRPFMELAASAEALGRGRFDLRLPYSRIPEVAAVSAALRSSAHNLERQFERNRDSVMDTSHALRTPLTGLRLELEEVMLRQDLDEDVRHSLARCLQDTQRLQDTIAELVEAERRRCVMGGRTVDVGELAELTRQRWRLGLPSGRDVQVLVLDGAGLSLTLGPVEQLLDAVLADVRTSTTGRVRLTLAGEESLVRIGVRTEGATAPTGTGPTAVRPGEAIAQFLGGHWRGDVAGDGLEILLPRR
ncbi:histidine kinase dimerization/phospho-acceptor domain-containing protein [Nocardioides sp. SYSU D00065]|uniref:histidine kinase dimerization/phospho-acceptor domain-containing protein n=1 Tax=Nocardioides sp. SYSU D00065 TaxID=2817378 RepID=UPI001B32568E|nr:histidine kinase dimerization/phospho-acceptor domain-containing protein [Nocardioides sp. SYSU D00065]